MWERERQMKCLCECVCVCVCVCVCLCVCGCVCVCVCVWQLPRDWKQNTSLTGKWIILQLVYELWTFMISHVVPLYSNTFPHSWLNKADTAKHTLHDNALCSWPAQSYCKTLNDPPFLTIQPSGRRTVHQVDISFLGCPKSHLVWWIDHLPVHWIKSH